MEQQKGKAIIAVGPVTSTMQGRRSGYGEPHLENTASPMYPGDVLCGGSLLTLEGVERYGKGD